jgi:hypothetical protein
MIENSIQSELCHILTKASDAREDQGACINCTRSFSNGKVLDGLDKAIENNREITSRDSLLVLYYFHTEELFEVCYIFQLKDGLLASYEYKSYAKEIEFINLNKIDILPIFFEQVVSYSQGGSDLYFSAQFHNGQLLSINGTCHFNGLIWGELVGPYLYLLTHKE